LGDASVRRVVYPSLVVWQLPRPEKIDPPAGEVDARLTFSTNTHRVGNELQQFEAGARPAHVRVMLTYDQLVLALGAMTNENVIPGSESALTFKTLGDAIVLRNH